MGSRTTTGLGQELLIIALVFGFFMAPDKVVILIVIFHCLASANFCFRVVERTVLPLHGVRGKISVAREPNLRRKGFELWLFHDEENANRKIEVLDNGVQLVHDVRLSHRARGLLDLEVENAAGPEAS